jgi:nicotinate-nucleotide pyrophosphorylase (carboxylating)
MIMLKDNHIDYCGGIAPAVAKTRHYLEVNGLDLNIVVEIRRLDEIEEALEAGGIRRLLLDNMDPKEILTAVEMIDGRCETEASGGITEANIRSYALAGVDFVSLGALTHSAQSLDLSLKAVI